MGEVSFKVSKPDGQLIDKIVKRAVKANPNYEVESTAMDITAVHANGNPLRLRALLMAKPFDFAHDMSGIRFNLNRNTGKLKNSFSPRFSVNS